MYTNNGFSGGTSPTYWLITTRTNWNSALLSSSSTVVLPTLASSDREVSMMPLITDTDSDYQERPLVFLVKVIVITVSTPSILKPTQESL